MKKRRKRRNVIKRFAVVAFLLAMVYIGAQKLDILQTGSLQDKPNVSYSTSTDTQHISAEVQGKIAAFAEKNHLQLQEWPTKLVELMEGNPDTEEFVLHYPLKKDESPSIDLTEYENSGTVPLFFQWDMRWGYSEYGDDLMGLSGCGPTCLSMVCVYLLNDVSLHPRYVADFSEEHGYCVPGSGSAWTLISEGGEKLGLDVEEISLDEEKVIQNLEAGNPIICIMGPGDFTTSGHFIVMTDYVDGKIRVNDSNSRIRSEKLWGFADIKGQIRNLWVCRS